MRPCADHIGMRRVADGENAAWIDLRETLADQPVNAGEGLSEEDRRQSGPVGDAVGEIARLGREAADMRRHHIGIGDDEGAGADGQRVAEERLAILVPDFRCHEDDAIHRLIGCRVEVQRYHAPGDRSLRARILCDDPPVPHLGEGRHGLADQRRAGNHLAIPKIIAPAAMLRRNGGSPLRAVIGDNAQMLAGGANRLHRGQPLRNDAAAQIEHTIGVQHHDIDLIQHLCDAGDALRLDGHGLGGQAVLPAPVGGPGVVETEYGEAHGGGAALQGMEGTYLSGQKPLGNPVRCRLFCAAIETTKPRIT